MCVSWCHKLNLLYWNHEDCSPALCDLAGRIEGLCQDCRHRAGTLCGLTRAPLPDQGGCCHHNVTLARGAQPVAQADLILLWPDPAESVTAILDRLEAPYTVAGDGRVLVDPDELGLPERYGTGTEPVLEPEPPQFNFESDDWYEW